MPKSEVSKWLLGTLTTIALALGGYAVSGVSELRAQDAANGKMHEAERDRYAEVIKRLDRIESKIDEWRNGK